jgi:hypothetical protein
LSLDHDRAHPYKKTPWKQKPLMKIQEITNKKGKVDYH